LDLAKDCESLATRVCGVSELLSSSLKYDHQQWDHTELKKENMILNLILKQFKFEYLEEMDI
jgi:hypothetical protein